MKSLLRSGVNLLPLSVRHAIKYVPIVAGLQRWLVNRVLSGVPFVHTINRGPAAGLCFEITLPLDKSVWAGTYESTFARELGRAVGSGDVCYDIGGYRGFMAGVMALAGASKVLVFEPLPENQKALRRLCELNPSLPIEIVSMAIGNDNGSTRLKVMPDVSMGKLANSTFQFGVPVRCEIEVVIRSLDSLVMSGEALPPNVIKLDVEGGELDVLHGAVNTLAHYRPFVCLEAHSAALEHACSDLLSQLRYEIHRLERRPTSDEQTRHLICRPKR
jgi:FkbM family methyltransferase